MKSGAPPLAEVQDRFQRAILKGDAAALLELVPGNGRTTADVLLGVYQGAYWARLAGVVASEHEHLKTYMGDAAFDAMARAYIAACPSRTPNARWVAEALPKFLASHEPFERYPQLAELALIERALAAAFDAPDAPTLTIADVQAIAPERWGDLVLRAHPSTRLLVLETNAYAIWSALKSTGDAVPPAKPLDEPERLLVWRAETTSMVRALGPEEAMMWEEASKGVPFGRLCELVAVFDDPETAAVRAAGYLQSWLGSGALTSVTFEARSVGTSRSRRAHAV